MVNCLKNKGFRQLAVYATLSKLYTNFMIFMRISLAGDSKMSGFQDICDPSEKG
jgi:hypothetical protein